MIQKAKDVSPDQRHVVENLVGRNQTRPSGLA
jgi:hypothetical protein